MSSGFEIFGIKAFDFSTPFSYFEIFSTAFIVCGSSFLIYLYLAKKAKNTKNKDKF